MGMLDTVTLRYRLSDRVTATEFQTKDLDCKCEFYEVSSEGLLHSWKRRWYPNRYLFDGMLVSAPMTVIPCILNRGR